VPLLQITNSNSSFEAGDDEPLEVDPSDPAVKQEMWMMGAGGGEDEDEDDEEGEFVIPPEQYEQDMQAEDEQYIQAGADGLSGSQVGRPPPYRDTAGKIHRSWLDNISHLQQCPCVNNSKWELSQQILP
jgi:hypothetical protein